MYFFGLAEGFKRGRRKHMDSYKRSQWGEKDENGNPNKMLVIGEIGYVEDLRQKDIEEEQTRCGFFNVSSFLVLTI